MRACHLRAVQPGMSSVFIIEYAAVTQQTRRGLSRHECLGVYDPGMRSGRFEVDCGAFWFGSGGLQRADGGSSVNRALSRALAQARAAVAGTGRHRDAGSYGLRDNTVDV